MRGRALDCKWDISGYVPKYRCAIPICDEGEGARFYADNGSYPDYVVAAIPEDSLETNSNCQLRRPKSGLDGITTCQQYVDALEAGYDTVTCSQDDDSTGGGGIFVDKSVVLASLVTDYQFTCGNYFFRDIYSGKKVICRQDFGHHY